MIDLNINAGILRSPMASRPNKRTRMIGGFRFRGINREAAKKRSLVIIRLTTGIFTAFALAPQAVPSAGVAHAV